jgi:hypothetical protein
MRGPANARRDLAGILFPRLPTDPASRVAVVILFLLGSMAAFTWLLSPLDFPVLLAAAGIATGAHVVAAIRGQRRTVRVGVAVARAVVALVWGVWGVTAVVFGAALGWAVPGWALAVVAVLAVIAVVDRVRGGSVRLPLALPVGLWIAMCILGWGREDGRIHCDDFRRIQADGRVDIVLPVHSQLPQCEPGRAYRLDRYMRRVWESPNGERLVFTTQPGIFRTGENALAALPAELAGSICEYRPKGAGVTCIGSGKSEGIVESADRDRLYVATWASPGMRKSGTVYALPRNGPLVPIAETLLDRPAVHMYLDSGTDRLNVLFDNCSGVLPLRASDLSGAGALLDYPFGAGDVFYDEARGEGLICFAPFALRPFDGEAAALVAFTGRPFTPRALAPSGEYPWMWLAQVWGCALDLETRDAWAVIADLGLLLRIDYDTGRIERIFFVGPGRRALVIDRARNRLYVAGFLDGNILALDMTTGATLDRWFAGRFVRGLTLSRDGNALWVGSNAGILRIQLDRPPDSGAGAPAVTSGPG